MIAWLLSGAGALIVQAATPAPPSTAVPPPTAAPPASAQQKNWSILVPVANEPCVPRRKGPQAGDARSDDIVVCGRPLPSQAVPYPEEVVPDHPVPSNPYLRGTGALAVEATPCGARSGGCAGGVDLFGAGTAVVRLMQKAVAPGSCYEDPGEGTNPVRLVRDAATGVAHAFRRKPDKTGRVPIALDDAPTGRVLP